MSSVFLGYAAADAPAAAKVTQALDSLGVQSWSAAATEPGQNVIAEIAERLSTADTYIFLISRDFSRSEWTQIEVAAAVAELEDNHTKRVIPVLVGPDLDPKYDVPSLLRNYQWLDLRGGISTDSIEPLARLLTSPPEETDYDSSLSFTERALAMRRLQLEREVAEHQAAIASRIRDRRGSTVFTMVLLLAVAGVVVLGIALWGGQEFTLAVTAAIALASAITGSVATLVVQRGSLRHRGKEQ